MSYHIRLKKSLSYTGVVSASKAKPDVYVEDKATADEAVATGFFEYVGETEDLTKDDEEKTGKLLEEMTVTELETFAAYKGISLKGISKKVDILTKIKAELPENETSGLITYGSPTMIDLQEA